MSLPSVRPVRLFWLLCAGYLLLPIEAAAGHSSAPKPVSHRTIDVPIYSSIAETTWHAAPYKRLIQTTSQDVEDDDFDLVLVRGDALPRAWSLLIGPPPIRGFFTTSRLRDPAPRRAIVSHAFVPRPPPAPVSL